MGTGLIGAALGLALLKYRLARAIIGYDTSVKNLRLAKRTGAITRPGRDIRRELAVCNLVILAMPVRAIRDWMRRYAKHVPTNTLVIDVGSVKKSIAGDGARFFPAGNFVACHPMAGSERAGPGTALAELFAGRTCFVTPGRSATWAVRRTLALWRRIGAQPVVVNPQTHDRITARISHLPQAVASVLAMTVRVWDRRGALSSHAGGGLKDMTRIAAGSSLMWRDILLENSTEVLASLDAFKTALQRLENGIRRGDFALLERFLRQAGEWRQKL